MAIRSWQTNWPEVSTFFDYPAEIRRIIYTTNSVESYHRQLRQVMKTKAAFPTPEAARKLLYLATQRVTRGWTAPSAIGPRTASTNWPFGLKDGLSYDGLAITKWCLHTI